MADPAVIVQPTAATIGPNASRNVVPLTIPRGVRSVSGPPDAVLTLQRQLQINQHRYQELDAYFRGQHRHSFDSVRFQQAFGRQLGAFADNWMKLVVNATVNRLKIQGFRIGDMDEEGVSEADAFAWRTWQASRLGTGSRMAYRDAMKFGTSFLLVDPFVKPLPRITVESPYQVVGQRDSVNRYRLLSAIKKWIGDDGSQYLNYYLPDVVMKFRASAPTPSTAPNDPSRILQTPAWYQVEEIENPLGVVPIVALENEPDPELGGQSDLDDLIPLNGGLNKVLRDMLVASEYQGFRQRWATGVEIPKDPETGQPLTSRRAQLEASQSNVWMFSNPAAKVGEFGQIDLTPYTAAIDVFIHHLSMVSMTPAYMLVGKIANLSADALRAAELGFVGKLSGKQEDFGPAQSEAIRLALLATGQIGPDDEVETIWKDAAANSGSILANELAIMSKLGVPQEAILEKYGYSPMTIARWKKSGALTAPDADAASQISPGPMDRGDMTPQAPWGR